MTVTLPTAKCTPGLHKNYGGACFYCCEACNHGRHRCHGCGDELRHDDTEWYGGKPHPCITPCEKCGHIGHYHGLVTCDECGPCDYEPVQS